MAVLAKIKKVPSNLPHGTSRPGFKGFLADKGERAAFAFGFGAAKGFYGEKWIYKGHGLDMYIGGVGLLACAAMNIAGGRRVGKVYPHFERFVDAAYMSALGSLGASWGMEHAGRSVHVSTPGKNATLAAKSTVLGHIPQAMGGAYLSPEEVQRFAAKR